MKIAVICPYALDIVGGVQVQAIQLTESLRAAGNEVYLVGPGNEASNGAIYVGPTVRLRVNRSVAPIALNPRSGRRASQAIADADVVHIHEPFAPFVSLRVLLEGRPPKVGTFHAAPDWGISLIYKTAAPLLRRLADRLAVATAVSPIAASWAAPLVNNEVRIIPNGLDVHRYQLSLPRKPHRVIFLGRDEPRKGLSVLLSAWVEVKRLAPTAELIVIGCKRSQPLPGVRYLGLVDERLKREELAQASIVCAPHLGQESFGLTLLEAMAAGCVVVASALPAFKRVLGDAGVLFPPGEGQLLSACLLTLLKDAKRRQELTRKGRDRAESYAWEQVLPEYLDAYRRAIESARHQTPEPKTIELGCSQDQIGNGTEPTRIVK